LDLVLVLDQELELELEFRAVIVDRRPDGALGKGDRPSVRRE
jgi:hypothetical protein